jgi:methylated-DNA-[protein]-cysteine S-methyltransferase
MMAILENAVLTRGPNLLVQFYVNDAGISKISFAVNPEKGFSWTLEGKSCPDRLQASISEWMNSYANKKSPRVRLPLIFKDVPAYTCLVLNTLEQIPFGNVLTYGELAELIGNPRSARAVGNACGSNPFPLIIPCHRVLSRGNRLGGFSSPLEIKRQLLDFEKISYIA